MRLLLHTYCYNVGHDTNWAIRSSPLRLHVIIRSCFLLLISWSVLVTTAHAQRTPNRKISINSSLATGSFMTDEIRMFQTKYPYLSVLPPITPSMPLPVKLGYVYLDSIARYAHEDSIRSFLRSLSPWNDTVAKLCSGYYQLVDWDPGRFYQYILETAFRRHTDDTAAALYTVVNGSDVRLDDTTEFVPSLYQTDLGEFERKLTKHVERFWPVPTERQRVRALLRSSQILRVRVDSLDSTHNRFNGGENFRYAAICTVLDTLKGKVFPDLCSESGRYVNPIPEQPSNHKENATPQSEGPCQKIRFVYTADHWLTGKHSFDNSIPFTVDSAFLNADQDFTLEPGDEAIVFLEYFSWRPDDAYDYWEIMLSRVASQGILRIENDIVYDPARIWTDTTKVPYAIFRTTVSELRERIVSGW